MRGNTMANLPLKDLCQLVLRAQGGDDSAFSKIYEATAQAQFFTALSILKDRPLAEDALQMIYIQVYRNLASLTIPERFLGWLAKINCNTCLDILRKQKRLEAELNDENPEELPFLISEANPLNTVIDRENREYLLSLLDGLSLEHRTILILRFYQELKVREIADVMGLSEGTVKSRIHYALRKLGKTLRENGFFGADSVLGAGIFLHRSFHPAGPFPGAQSHKKNNGRTLSPTAAISVLVPGLLMLGAARYFPAASIKEVKLPEKTAYTNESVPITIQASVEDRSKLRAYYTNGEELPIVQISADTFRTAAHRNGKIKITVDGSDGLKDQKSISVTQVDREVPVLRTCTYRNGYMTVKLTDNLSGIDESRSEIHVNNTLYKKDTVWENGNVTFPCGEKDRIEIRAKDRAGNSKTFRMIPVDKITGN